MKEKSSEQKKFAEEECYWSKGKGVFEDNVSDKQFCDFIKKVGGWKKDV